MRPFWIGLVAGVVLVGLGVGIGVSIERQRGPAVYRVEPVPPAAAATGPVRLSGAQSSAGWIATFHLPERARSVEYRRGQSPEWTPLGPNPHDIDPRTGAPRPKTYAMLGELDGPTPLSVRYTNDAGERRGPFDLRLDPTAESIKTLRSLLDDLPTWIHIGDHAGRRLAYFTTLLVYKPAITAIRYGIDSDRPDRSLRFEPSETLGIAADDQVFVPLPPDAREIVVEVVLRDGSSLRRRFGAR